MSRSRVLAGIGAIAFSVLTIVALGIANPPGGTFKASDAVKYIAKGHHVAVFVAAYLFLIAVLGLLFLLAYLRDLISGRPDGERTARIFWGTGVAAATSFAVGWAIVVGNAIAHAYGGRGVVVPPTVTYLASELGYAVVFGPAAVLLGLTLITLMLGSRKVLPAWLRWATLVAGLGGVASLAFFPSALLIAWGIVIGIWLLVTSRRPDAQEAPMAPTAA
jgi:hypothetical protein